MVIAAIDLEALAELNFGLCDQLLVEHLALDQRQLPKIMPVQIQQIESDRDDLVDLPLSSF